MSVEQCQLMGSGSISASDCTLSFVASFAVMESSADVVGVDIPLFPVEEEEKAPSPPELPMPSFGFQGMEIAGDFQPPSAVDKDAS